MFVYKLIHASVAVETEDVVETGPFGNNYRYNSLAYLLSLSPFWDTGRRVSSIDCSHWQLSLLLSRGDLVIFLVFMWSFLSSFARASSQSMATHAAFPLVSVLILI